MLHTRHLFGFFIVTMMMVVSFGLYFAFVNPESSSAEDLERVTFLNTSENEYHLQPSVAISQSDVSRDAFIAKVREEYRNNPPVTIAVTKDPVVSAPAVVEEGTVINEDVLLLLTGDEDILTGDNVTSANVLTLPLTASTSVDAQISTTSQSIRLITSTTTTQTGTSSTSQ